MKEDNFSTEQLLEHVSWLNGLARALVRDDGRAADAVQETWLAVLTRPPQRLTRALLSKVLKNRIIDSRLNDSARAAREIIRQTRRRNER